MKLYLAVWPHGGGGAPRDIAGAMNVYLAAASIARETPPARTMKLYLSASTKQSKVNDNRQAGRAALLTSGTLRMLLSYHYFKDQDLAETVTDLFPEGLKFDLMADSGAFSAYTTGATITVREYAAWLEKEGHRFTCAAALDVLGDAKASFEQTRQLRKLVSRELVPDLVPVFHSTDDSWDWLQRYLDDGYGYIGISPTGAIYQAPTLLEEWLTRCFELRPGGVRYHGFGVTGFRSLRAFPWWSCDSSSWTSAMRYGNLALFDERAGSMAKIDMKARAGLMRHARILADYGLRPSEVTNRSYTRERLLPAIVESYQRLERWMTERATKVHGQWRRDGDWF